MSKRVHFKSDENENAIPNNNNNSSTTSSTSSSSINGNNLITVGVRVRPLNDKEKTHHNSIKLNDRNNEIIIYDRQSKLNSFTCDFIITDQEATSPSYEPLSLADSQQQYVYDCVGRPLLDKAYDGYNVSIFAYGQTGSGKTYSMIGTSGQPGLIPRFFDELFKKKHQRDQIVSSTHIEFSYYEIYNEKIYDLLGSSSSAIPPSKSNQIGSSPMVVGNATGTTNSRSLQIRENPTTGPYVVGLLTLSANSAADAKLWLDIGNKRRATACTNMNQKSSRSHSVFQINLTQMLEHQQQTSKSNKPANSLLQLVTSKINLVDLAGSERINTAFGNQTQSSYSSFNTASSSTNSSRFKESTCINKSLLTLGKIICLLSDREISSSTASITNNKYLPYRESVLTWLLKESLGGNAKTAMLATVNSSSFYLDETLCTLRYAAKTACIKNEACLNRNFKQKYIDEFGKEVELSLIMPPMSTSMTGLPIHTKSNGGEAERSAQLELTIKQMEQEWKEKLEEAERLKQKEIKDLEKSLIVLYENETRAQNCCLINLNEDPSLSEKLIYLLKSSQNAKESNEPTVTMIGSDKTQVNIHLSGPLIAPQHCQIWCKYESGVLLYFIEQLDDNYVTYLNGEVIDSKWRQLSHGDRIIFGGSHFFRFNNPSANAANKQSANSSLTQNDFKDYQFAKNEIERKQTELIEVKLKEALSKCKQDGDLKLKELEKKFEKKVESMQNELEKEKLAKKLEVEQIKTESNAKLKQIVQKKILIETKLNEIEVASTSQSLDKHDKQTSDDSVETNLMRTPLANNLANRRFLTKLNEFSSAKKNQAFDKHEIIQTHTNASSLFAITLRVTEANKICNLIKLNYEFKRYEVLESLVNNEELDSSVKSTDSARKSDYIQAVSVLDKSSQMITLWSLDKFDHKLNILREIYSRIYEDEDEIDASKTEYQTMILDSNEEWQSLEKFNQNDENFSPKVIENSFNQNETKSCKRQLSISCNDSVMSKSDTIDESQTDALDSIISSNKRKCLNSNNFKLMPPPTPLSCMKPSIKSFESDLVEAPNDLNKTSNVFFYSKLRDALVDDLIQSDQSDDENSESDDEKENEKKNKNKIAQFDDVYLKYYICLVLNLTKLFAVLFDQDSELSLHKKVKKSLRFDDKEETSHLRHHVDTLNLANVDQSVYAAKLFALYSHLSLFRPDLTSKQGDERHKQLKQLYSKIRKNLKILKETICLFFQSIEKEMITNVKCKYENILEQTRELIQMHGEFMFLNCANTFLTNKILFNMIESSFLKVYVEGLDKQYELYLKTQIQSLRVVKPVLVDFLQSMENFRHNCENFKYASNDLMIDYSNYVFQSNLRLTNAVRFIEKDKEALNASYSDQILMFFYNILTDSLAFNTTASATITSETCVHKSSLKHATDKFIITFKKIKSFYQTHTSHGNSRQNV